MTTTRTIRTYRVEVPGKLWTLNAERGKMHWPERARRTSEFRYAAAILTKAAGVPRLDRAQFTATAHQGRRGRIADPGAFVGPIKAVIDGLIDAKVLPDDDQDHLELAHRPNVRDGWEGIEIVIEPMEGES